MQPSRLSRLLNFSSPPAFTQVLSYAAVHSPHWRRSYEIPPYIRPHALLSRRAYVHGVHRHIFWKLHPVYFESLDPAHKGFINLNEFNCFLLLQAINRQTYRSVYDEQLRGTPSGRFENPAALIAIFQQYELSHRMSFNADAVSVQGAAYLTQSKVSSAAPANLNPDEKAPYCTFCFTASKGTKRFTKHTSEMCSKNPKSVNFGKFPPKLPHKPKSAFAAIAPGLPDNAVADARILKLEAQISALVSLMTTDHNVDSAAATHE